jgi:acyl-CoA reductase-like NAD-dependent aldehyde dehydrogenase
MSGVCVAAEGARAAVADFGSDAAMIENADRFFIGEIWPEPSTGSTFALVNPTTEEVFDRVAEAFEPDIDRAVTAARQAFDNSSWLDPETTKRAWYVKAIGDILMARSSSVART